MALPSCRPALPPGDMDGRALLWRRSGPLGQPAGDLVEQSLISERVRDKSDGGIVR